MSLLRSTSQAVALSPAALGQVVAAPGQAVPLDSTALDSTALNSTALDSTALDSTALDSTALNSTALDSTLRCGPEWTGPSQPCRPPIGATGGDGLFGDGSTISLLDGYVRIQTTLLFEIAAVALAVVLWFVLLAAVVKLTRPADVDAAPASADLAGDEPPAVVSLLANRWRLTEDAVESTLLDLAARRWIELRQPGNDPMHTTVHLLAHAGGRPPKEARALTRYEEMVLARVRSEAVGGAVPITALTFRNAGESHTWTTRLHQFVIEDARARGLSRRRFSAGMLSFLSASATVPGVLAGLLMAERGAGIGLGFGAAIMLWGALSGYAVRPQGERDTPAGREAAAGWLGLRTFLRNDGAFAELPPAAVAIWDRYLAYGDALGVTRVCGAVLDLGMGDRTRVWSSFGGTWHRVRVRYPTFWGRYGASPGSVLLGASAALLLGALMVRFLWFTFQVPDDFFSALGDVPVAIGSYLLVRGVYRLVRWAGDLLAPRTITGEVLWLEPWKQTQPTEDTAARPIVHYLAVDDGTGDRTTAWALPSEWSGRVRPGDVVTMTVRPWTRRVAELAVDSSRAAQLAQAAGVPAGVVPAPGAAPDGSAGADPRPVTGAAPWPAAVAANPFLALIPGLGADVVGSGVTAAGAAPGAGGAALPPVLGTAAVAAGIESAQGGGPAAVPQLLSVEEVATALGRPVVSDAAGARIRLGPFELVTFSDPAGGAPMLVAAVARGPAVGLVLRGLRRGGQPLAGIGEEAWAGNGWVTGRKADTLVRLTVPGTPAPPDALPHLLGTALSRL